MSTIQENLQTIADSTTAIKQAIIDKGGTVGDITTWASAISGLSSGGNIGDSGDSNGGESIVFRGTMSLQPMGMNIAGTLFAPENIVRGHLVMMDYYMRIVTSFQFINSSTTTINLTLDYGEPILEYMNPILILMYSLPEDAYGKWRAQVVPVIAAESGDSPN